MFYGLPPCKDYWNYDIILSSRRDVFMYNQNQIFVDVGRLADFVNKSVALGCAIDTPCTPNKVANVVNASLEFVFSLMRCVATRRRW